MDGTTGLTWRHLASASLVLAMLAGFALSPCGRSAEFGLGVSICLAAVLALLGVIDIYTLRLPDPLTLGLLAAGLAVSALAGLNPFLHSAIGAVLGYALIRGLKIYWQHRRGEDGIGLGDAKLLAAAGAWTGWIGLPQILLFGSGLALVFVLIGKISGQIKDSNARIPFGPFLALGIWLIWRTGGVLEFATL